MESECKFCCQQQLVDMHVLIIFLLQSNKESFQVPLRKKLQNITEAEKSHDSRALDWLNLWSLTVIINVIPQLNSTVVGFGLAATRDYVAKELD